MSAPPALSERLAAIDWSQFSTAYGRADQPHAFERRDGSPAGRWGSIPEQLARLWSDDRRAALEVTHHLWCSLCHQHAYVSSAALPALPFLLEALDGADDAFSVELLDIAAGIAVCARTGSAAPAGPWLEELRAALLRERARFERLATSAGQDVASFAQRIVADLDAMPR
ncbi:hypothetical protein [Sandaracinus amylolyticus]|uniref:hypothetical protein n=1 Tax=Sandaracinus amylolyticus TaxID=927083 RepID=UPI001F2FEEA4|nr:hypothetical protein [Sandaracinus amylolyticus]UJR86857.1 Hypothetical protein I5071_89580 [Sandaracinus amylolyticus]